jgi:SpoVK/Ycf46/Vps4 family AAA+-type ATPase
MVAKTKARKPTVKKANEIKNSLGEDGQLFTTGKKTRSVEFKRRSTDVKKAAATRKKSAVKRITVRKTMSKKRLQSNINTNRRGIYFSGKLQSSKDLTEKQNYFKEKNQKEIRNDKPLYIFDLPKVSSRYIGEIEKNLDKIFEKTKNMNGILIFDEADALFGKRSNVKDSHDKYANLEISYLLQRLEKYKGVVFISSNFKKPTTKQSVAKLDCVI